VTTVEVETVVDRSVTQALETMLLIRTFEEKSAELQASGKSPSMCTSVGQEASAAGVMSALGENDLILTNHRSAGHLLARGADPNRVMAEIQGRATGYCGGKGGSMHIVAKECGFITATGVVNFLNFTFSALLGPVFGWIFQLVSNGSRTPLETYQTTFHALLYGIGVGIILTFFLKETGPAARRTREVVPQEMS